ncbi:MAG: Tex family protein [Bacteroidia bacterium]
MSEAHYAKRIALQVGVAERQVEATRSLLDEGATIPFISRYRKEVTGSLDEVQIAAIRDELERLRALDSRRDAILKSIRAQGKLTPELETALRNADNLSKLEDLYLPYKPKRRTRATIAREKGLEPLAQLIFAQGRIDLQAEAGKFVNAEKEVATSDEALEGARDIIAEWINEKPEARDKIRLLFKEKAVIRSRVVSGKEEAAAKFEDYFEWEEPLLNCPSHRLLAMRRGEKEDFLYIDISPPEQDAFDILKKMFVTGTGSASEQVRLAAEDCYSRMMEMSIETEMRLLTKQTAEEKAIQVFADNLRELLLAPALGQRTTLALDPGFRSGCKLVVLNRQGKLMEHTVIYPHEPQRQTREAEQILVSLCIKHDVEAISIGNGTAGRETETFVRSIKGLPKDILIIMVNESGASVYSASEAARDEFPEQDVTVRGAVSIGRRLCDPLAELVKIDPKAIGVGQYQHDVDQNHLKKKLDEVVESCVNGVGVELNTASKQLLTYVSGLGPVLAQHIVDFRNENGPFKSRKELMKVPRMGEKVFEQSAGFLRIRDGENPLDQSSVHPESYKVVEQMAADLKCKVQDLMADKVLRKQIVLQKYVNEKTGLPTLNDILKELDKPGRDPRKDFEIFSFGEGVNAIEDLKVGIKLPGIVTNVTNFGAFVDIGVHQDGLVHISQLSNAFVDDPNKVVKVAQKVNVTVTEVDVKRKRIALSMKDNPVLGASAKSGSGNFQSAPSKPAESDLALKLAALKGKFK